MVNQFMAHGSCFLWNPYLTGLHFVADLLVAFAYLLIPFYLTRGWHRIPAQYKPLAYLGAAFVLSCGFGHFIAAVNLFNTYYWVQGWQKFVTAIVSLVAAVAIGRLLPELIRLGELNKGVIVGALDGLIVFKAKRATEGEIIDFTFELTNPSALKMMNRSSLAGASLVRDYPDNIMFDRYCRVLETGENFTGDVYSPSRSWYQIQAVRLNDSEVLVAFRDITALKHLTFIDPLTELYNRRFLSEVDFGCNVLAFIDLDHFKRINDALGHHVGDVMLAQVAQRIKASIRPNDIAARVGGDEFAVVFSDGLSRSVAQQIAHRIVAVLEQPFNIDGRDLLISASVGVAFGSGQSIPDLLREADTAMYRRKRDRSLDSVVIFEPWMLTEIEQEEQINQELREAIQHKQLELHYQRIVNLREKTYPTIGFEALVRWHHPDGRLRFPDEFIPTAEKSGLIHQIADYVLREAYAQAAVWYKRYHVPLKIGVNLSAWDLGRMSFLDVVKETLAQELIKPDSILFEITETAFSDVSSRQVKAMAAGIKETGALLGLDDFGTGFNTLEQLVFLPFDAIKIDREFVSGDSASMELCALILPLAKFKDRQTIAEGIESLEQAEQLRNLGCQYGQGYYFGRPVPAADAEALLREELGL